MQNKYINASFFYLRALPDALAELFKKHNESMSKIRRKARLEPNASQYDVTRAEREKSGELTAARDAALKELSEMRTAAATKQEIADRHLERELAGQTPAKDTATALLNETRQQSAWMRLKPLLDRQTDIEPLKAEIASLVKGFIQPVDDSPGAFDSSDLDSIIALKKELPFYIKGRFAPMEADLYVEQSIDALEAALASTRPAYAEAVNLKKELKTGMIQITTAFNYAQAAIENNETETIIPVWLKGETMMLK